MQVREEKSTFSEALTGAQESGHRGVLLESG